MRKAFLYASVLLVAILPSCVKETVQQNAQSDGKVKVTLDISVDPVLLAEETATKAVSPLDPHAENPIKNLWVIQYNEMGERCSVNYWEAVNPVIAKRDYMVDLEDRPVSTIVVLANFGDITDNGAKDGDHYTYVWPGALGVLRTGRLATDMSLSLDRDNGHNPSNIFMVGQTTLTSAEIASAQHINVILSRLVAKIAVNIRQEKTAGGYQFKNLSLKILNSVKGIVPFPDDNTSSAGYLYDYVGENIPDDQFTEDGVTRYYYVNENLDEDNPTKLSVSVRGKGDNELRTRIYPINSYKQVFRNTYYTLDITVAGNGG